MIPIYQSEDFSLYCILTYGGAGCSSYEGGVIAGYTCVNRKAAMRRCMQLTWVEPEIHRNYEIIYTQVPTE